MNEHLKTAVGRATISLASALPKARGFLRSAGLRCTQGRFGARAVDVPLPDGGKLRLTHADESYLAFQLFWHGIDFYEPITRALIRELLQPGALFLDLGAHIGFFSLTAALQGAEVVAFEPNPKNFAILTENVRANGLENVVVEPMAISDKDARAALYLTESDMSASLMKGFQAEDTVQTGEVEVRTITVDSYLDTSSRQAPAMIKVDMEGHETAFFRGAARTIAAYKPDIILEVLYDADPQMTTQLKSLGYHFYPITDKTLFEVDSPRLIKRFPFLFLNYLLSTRPRPEVANLFDRVHARTRHIDLKRTSKHFPPSEWPALWPKNAPPHPGATG